MSPVVPVTSVTSGPLGYPTTVSRSLNYPVVPVPVPIHTTKTIVQPVLHAVPVPHPVPYPVSVPKPYPVGVPVVKTVEKIVEVEVPRPVAVPVLVKPTPALDNKSPNSAVMNAVA